MFTQALAQIESWHRLNGEGPWYWSWQAYIYGRAGQTERARRELGKLEKGSPHEQGNSLIMLWAHLGVGDKGEALADLEKGHSRHFKILTSLQVEPGLDAHAPH